MNPFVISMVIMLLVISTLIFLDIEKTDSSSTNAMNNYYKGHDEYGKNTCSYDEYSYEECENNEDENQITSYDVFGLVRQVLKNKIKRDKMVKKFGMSVLMVIIVLIIMTATAVATVTTPPASISKLHKNSRGTDYIDWGWTDPTTSDFNHVDVYINGKFTASVNKGVKHYKAIGLSPGTKYTIGIRTVDKYENINPTLKTNKQTTKGRIISNVIRFMTIGDPHVTSDTSADPYVRLTGAIDYINSRTDVDFTVVVGDIADSATTANFGVAKNALDRLKKPYYVIPGNHDIGSSISKFESYFGPAENIVNKNGYQLIFVGIAKDASKNKHWTFDFSKADKSKPTIIFNHGPVQPKPGSTSCVSSWGIYYGYSCDMKSEVDGFSKLLGYYDGHVHTWTSQSLGGERYVSEDNLGGNGAASDYIGYTKIDGNVLTYNRVLY